MKRALWPTVATLGTTVGAFALYALTHPAVMALALIPPMRISDRDAKQNLRPVQKDALLHQVAHLPTSRV